REGPGRVPRIPRPAGSRLRAHRAHAATHHRGPLPAVGAAQAVATRAATRVHGMATKNIGEAARPRCVKQPWHLDADGGSSIRATSHERDVCAGWHRSHCCPRLALRRSAGERGLRHATLLRRRRAGAGGPNRPRQHRSHPAAHGLRHVARAFRTLRLAHGAVAGLSMGGFGAMSYAARHRGLFRAAASFSGAVDTRYVEPASGIGFNIFHDTFGTPDDRVWGNQVTDEATWRAHNPTDRAADLGGVELFVATGTGTPGGPAGDDPSNPGGYFIEQVIFQMNLSFGRALDAAGVPSHRDFYLGGYHGWPYWERELHWALPQIVDVIQRTTR